MKFCFFVELFERLESLGSQDRQRCRRVFESFFEAFILHLDDEIRLKTIRSLLLLLFSSLDKSRSYLIKETKLASLSAKVFNLDRSRQEQLSKWLVNNPENQRFSIENSLGDFGAVLEKVLVDARVKIGDDYKRSTTTIFQITELLNSLSKLSSWTTCEEKPAHYDTTLGFLKSLFLPHTPVSCKWIARTILKSFNTIDFKPEQLMRAIHPCLYGIYCNTASLDRTALVLNEILCAGFSLKNMFDDFGRLNFSKYRLIMQKYACPTLGERIISMESMQALSIAHVFNQLYESGESEFIAQHKYDGERMQIHLNGDVDPLAIKIYSKTGRDSTLDRKHSHNIIRKALLSKLDADGTPKVKTCIVEAELLVIDKETRKIEVFGGVQAFRGKIKLQSQPNLGTYLVFFDLLALNGTNLMAFPLSYRYEKLIDVLFLDHSCRLPDMKRICIPPEKSEWSLKTFLDLKLMFLDVINNGGEGLMIKGLNSPYEAGSRDHWMKLKPDYVLGNGECHEYAVVGAGWDPTLDYVKVDFNECHGMNTFFIGCITNKSEVQLLNAKPHVLICFTVQTGFGRKDLVDFSAKMQSKRVLAEKSSTISSFTWTMSLSAKMLYFFHDPATFTIQGSSYEWKRNYWVVRHPRLVRECTLDRPWKEHSTTFQEMQLFGKTARAPTCFEIHELDKVISKYDNEYLKTGKITKDIRPLSKTDPASSRDYFESKAEGLKTSTFHIRYEQIDEIEDGAVLDLDKIWVFHFNVRDSSPLYRKIIKSPDALFLIAGWNCEGQNCDAQHEDIAIFSLQCEAEKICKQIESIIETIPKSAICIHSKALYILDAAYLTTERTNLNSQFILAQYSLY